MENNKSLVVEQETKYAILIFQAPPGRVASGEKIGVISFGTQHQQQQQQQQDQQQYRSVWTHVTLYALMLGLFLVQIANNTKFFQVPSSPKIMCL
jgi:hypothetical protein